jgi:hypothetical protein
MNLDNSEIEFLVSLMALLAKGFLALLIFIFITALRK